MMMQKQQQQQQQKKHTHLVVEDMSQQTKLKHPTSSNSLTVAFPLLSYTLKVESVYISIKVSTPIQFTGNIPLVLSTHFWNV